MGALVQPPKGKGENMETIFNTETGKMERVSKWNKPVPKRGPVDEDTQENLRENQHQKRGSGFYSSCFGLTGDDKDRFLNLKDSVSVGLEKLQEAEKASRSMLIEIGSNAFQIQLLVQKLNSGKSKHKRVSHRAVFQFFF